MTSILTRAAQRPFLLLVQQQQQQKHAAVLITQRIIKPRTMVTVTKTSTTNKSSLHESSAAATTSVDTNNQLYVTDSCIQRIQSLAEKRQETLNEVYLRVYVDAGGCSGFQYKFEMTRDSEEAVDPQEDKVFSRQDCRVVVDEDSLKLIEGSTIDFVQEMIKSGFAVINNPQSESACGCGSSFAIKNFEVNPALD